MSGGSKGPRMVNQMQDSWSFEISHGTNVYLFNFSISFTYEIIDDVHGRKEKDPEKDRKRFIIYKSNDFERTKTKNKSIVNV